MGVAAIFGIFAANIFLVPEDVRPHDERAAWERFISGSPSSAPIASSCPCTSSESRAASAATRMPPACITSQRLQFVHVHQFMTIAAFITGSRAAFLSGQFFLEPEERRESHRKIRGMPQPSNGSPIPRRRLTIISGAIIPASIVARTNSACRARRTTSFRRILQPQEVARKGIRRAGI